MQINHQNHDYSSGYPLSVGDRYYAQDMGRDFWAAMDQAGAGLGALQIVVGSLLSGGLVTEGSSKALLNVTAMKGFVNYDVTVPLSYVSLPPSTQTKQVRAIVEMGAQTDFDWTASAGATADNVTPNFLKVRYAETNGSTRTRYKSGGSYSYEKIPAFTLVCNPTAATAYEVVLATIIGNGGANLTITQAYPSIGSDQTVSSIMRRDSAGRAKVVDPSAAQDIATKNYVDEFTAPYTIISSDTTLTKVGKYRITAFCNVTLPASVDIGDCIEIYAEHACRIYQSDAENIIENSGWSTTKGITSTPDNNGIKHIRLEIGNKIGLMYKGVMDYYPLTMALVSLTFPVTDGVKHTASWSPDDNYVVMGSNNNVNPSAAVYKLTGDTLTLLDVLSETIYDQYNQGVSWSPCGRYIVVTLHNFGVKACWYKVELNETFTYLGAVPNITASQVVGATWSPDSTMLYLTHGSVSPYVSVYTRTGDVLTYLSSLPSITTNGSNLSVTNDGLYVAVSCSTTSPYAQWWKIKGTTFSYIGAISITGTVANSLAWSPDGKYLAISYGGTSPYCGMFKRTGNVLSLLTNIPGSQTGVADIKWSLDGRYVAMTGTPSPFNFFYSVVNDVFMFEFSGTFQATTLSWSPNCKYLLAPGSTPTFWKTKAEAIKGYVVISFDAKNVDYRRVLK